VAPEDLGPGTPVRRTSMLVLGATGTLGRQVVRRALDQGYEVRCLVRPREAPAEFLSDWGASKVNGDLTKPWTLPPALVGIHTVVDCATSRPEESATEVDWEGKKALIQACQAMKIQRFLFFSVNQCDQYEDVPLMDIKYKTERFLAESGLNYTTFRLCGFMQAIIGNYALPILEERPVWGTTDMTRTAYIDSGDAARLALAAVDRDVTFGKTLDLSGPRALAVPEIIALCERYAGQDAQVNNVPVWLLNATRAAVNFFQWSRDAGDRLAFAEVLSSGAAFAAPMDETYRLLEADPADTTVVEKYLQEYFSQILQKLREVNAESRQGDFYL
jgi:uncharacterized protein YbjT (DUF2867 family)